MIWLAIILAAVVGVATAILKRSLFLGLRTGLVTLLFGIGASLVIVLSGILGG